MERIFKSKLIKIKIKIRIYFLILCHVLLSLMILLIVKQVKKVEAYLFNVNQASVWVQL